jgi:dolichol-phosphate mannosyltransferase
MTSLSPVPSDPSGPAMAPKRRLVSICVPVLNEAENIPRLIARLNQLADANPAYDFEFLFTDNASTDDTFAMLAEAARTDSRIRALSFSRNFGFQRSVLTNLLEARGDAAVQVDADLQDPPELITEFLAKWEQGYKVVYGIRRRRQENFVINGARQAFYRLIRALSEVEVPVDAGDFRLIDRAIIEQLRAYQDRSPYVRGLISSIGFAQIGIPYDRAARIAGKSKFNFSKLVLLAVDGICSQSTKPLHYITLFGIAISVISFLSALIYLVAYFFIDYETPGFTTLVLIVLASIGMNSLFIGLIGEYVGRIYDNVRSAPLVIVDRRIEPLGAAEPDATPTQDRLS